MGGGPESRGGAVRRLCTPQDTVHVPDAERAITACLPDITTPGLLRAPEGHYTDREDWPPLRAAGTGYRSTATFPSRCCASYGTLDILLPISIHGDVYARMIANAHRDQLHHYYRIEGQPRRQPW
jgi:hypothetical protein